MAKNKEARVKTSETPRWLVTYADMVTLLLCLFVMLYATGKATPQEVQLILSAFNNSLGFFTGGQTLSKGTLEQMGMSLETLPSQTRERTLSEEQRQARSIFQSEIEARKVRVTEDERGIIISLISADYFNPGSALLSPPIEEVLSKVAILIKDLERYVRVEGHSSADEANTIYSASNSNQEERVYINSWDLSAARAINAASFIQNQGVTPSWMQAVGYGSYRPLALVSRGTPEVAAHNRRIDIVLLSFKNVKRPQTDSHYNLPDNQIPGTEAIIPDKN